MNKNTLPIIYGSVLLNVWYDLSVVFIVSIREYISSFLVVMLYFSQKLLYMPCKFVSCSLFFIHLRTFKMGQNNLII